TVIRRRLSSAGPPVRGPINDLLFGSAVLRTIENGALALKTSDRFQVEVARARVTSQRSFVPHGSTIIHGLNLRKLIRVTPTREGELWRRSRTERPFNEPYRSLRLARIELDHEVRLHPHRIGNFVELGYAAEGHLRGPVGDHVIG